MRDKVFAALLAPAIIVGAIGLWYLFIPKTETNSEAKKPIESEPIAWRHAKMACEESIKKRLHDPDSAQFQPRSENVVVSVERDGYNVFTSVRAKNGFNAMRLSSYKCEIRQLHTDARGGLTWQAKILELR